MSAQKQIGAPKRNQARFSAVQMDHWLASEPVPGAPPNWATMPREVLTAAQNIAENGRFSSGPLTGGDEARGGNYPLVVDHLLKTAQRQVNTHSPHTPPEGVTKTT